MTTNWCDISYMYFRNSEKINNKTLFKCVNKVTLLLRTKLSWQGLNQCLTDILNVMPLTLHCSTYTAWTCTKHFMNNHLLLINFYSAKYKQFNIRTIQHTEIPWKIRPQHGILSAKPIFVNKRKKIPVSDDNHVF